MNRRSLPPRSLSSDQLPRRKSPMQTSATDVPLVMDDQPSAPLRSVLRTASSSTSSKGLKPSTTNKDVASIFSNRSISVSEHRVRPSRDLSRHNSSQHLQKRLSSKRLDSLERTTSDASLDTSLLPRRGRKRQGLNNLSISSRDNNSFILNNSQHSFSSEESFHAGSFREKTTSSSSHRPRPINKSTIVLSVIWSLALFCLGGLFAQNYAVITDRSTVKFGDELHRDGKASGEGFIRNQEQHGAQVTTTQHREKPSKFRNSFVENTKSLEQFQILHGVDSIRKVITAYTESPLLDTVPGTGSRDNPNDKSFGVVPTFIIPLPRRATTPDDLKEHLYPAARTCHDLPAKFPVDEGLQLDAETGQQIVWNLGKEPTPTDFPEAQAKHCPVEMDPFLPWIHDVVASSDGSKIEFVAQNMRRCRTGKAQTDNVNRLVPQVTLMQAVSVQRINESLAQDLAPELWKGDTTANDNTARYRLAPLEEASHDGKETRFICRFHTTRVENGTLVDVILGETLSEFPFNYEFLSYRKEKRSLLSPKGTDGALFWASSLQFNCPTPNITALRTAIALGTTVSQDGSATLHVDIAPIRTSVRYDEVYLSDNQIGPHAKRVFDPVTRWGAANVLPRFEASGRWANIPICRPPKSIVQKEMTTSLAKSVKDEQNVNSVWTESTSLRLPQSTNGSSTKLHYLSACLWASAEFKQRGESRLKNSDTTDRLQEWIEFHLLAGFDHIYVYDNSGAHTNETSLEPILNQYPSTQVTRIDWPSTVCNNNRPSDDSPGERSSQYAAETSCRVRYGSQTEWIASFDTDEYFVPMGNYSSLKDVLKDAHDGGANILSFRSSRGKLRMDKSDAVYNDTAIQRSSSSTFLEAYNCDVGGMPKPAWAERAKKQIYRTDYVLHHFVHYSTATKGAFETFQSANGSKWLRRYQESAPSEIFTDELTQAVMVHTKSIDAGATNHFQKSCRYDTQKKWQECRVAVPWPNGTIDAVQTYDEDSGLNYNCLVNAKVEDYWIPRVKEALRQRQTQRGHS